jgi:hypothetical protein
MKSIIFLSILLGLILISSTQCTKEAKEPNYRDAYMGDYNFTIKSHYYYATDSTFKDTIYYFSGYITKSDYSSSSINLYYKPNFHAPANISHDGKLDKIYGFGIAWALGGKFEGTDSVFFAYILPLTLFDSVYGKRK